MKSSKTTKLIQETIEFPVKYDPKQQSIWDSKGMMICDIRGWGRIQFMNRAEERQDAIGEKIAQLLNESVSNQKKLNDDAIAGITNLPSPEQVVPFEWD